MMNCAMLGLAQPRLVFKNTKQHFGFVKKGEVVRLEFHFINKGDEPLMIMEAKAACSCTTVDFPKQPILPGQSSKMIIYFDTKSVYDRQDRMVEVLSNAKNANQTIRFKGVVLHK